MQVRQLRVPAWQNRAAKAAGSPTSSYTNAARSSSARSAGMAGEGQWDSPAAGPGPGPWLGHQGRASAPTASCMDFLWTGDRVACVCGDEVLLEGRKMRAQEE